MDRLYVIFAPAAGETDVLSLDVGSPDTKIEALIADKTGVPMGQTAYAQVETNSIFTASAAAEAGGLVYIAPQELSVLREQNPRASMLELRIEHSMMRMCPR